jgi:prevent-host-death family protein
MTKTITATEASNNFGGMVDEAARGRSLFIVTRMGKPRAIVVGVDQYLELLEELETIREQEDPEFQALLAKAREDIELGRSITLEELDKEFGFTDDELDATSTESDEQ